MRTTMTIVAVAAALVAAGCGDDDDDSESADTVESAATEATGGAIDSEDVTMPSIPDITVADISIPDITAPDITIPDITIPDISLPDISLPDISLPGGETMERIIASIFPNLNEEQVSCLAEAFGENFDPSEVVQMAEDCDIEASDLRPGG